MSTSLQGRATCEPPPAPSFQTYQRVSAHAEGFCPRVGLAVTSASGLIVQCLEENSHGCSSQRETVSEHNVPVQSSTLVEPSGPLANLLFRINKSPSSDLLRHVYEVDQKYEPFERVASIHHELKDALKGERPPTDDRVFLGFKTEATLDQDGDDHKNLVNYDPDQEPEIYEYSSDPRLEMADAFGLGESSVTDEQ